MKTNSSDKTESRWQKTPVANLVRHIQSGNYYARIRVRGKLIWKSLKTDRISVAKLRLGDFHKEERQRAEAQTAVARGKMTFADALQTYRERLSGDQSLKERSKTYRQERIAALLKSWPDLNQMDVAQISKTDGLAWAARFWRPGRTGEQERIRPGCQESGAPTRDQRRQPRRWQAPPGYAVP